MLLDSLNTGNMSRGAAIPTASSVEQAAPTMSPMPTAEMDVRLSVTKNRIAFVRTCAKHIVPLGTLFV